MAKFHVEESLNHASKLGLNSSLPRYQEDYYCLYCVKTLRPALLQIKYGYFILVVARDIYDLHR